MSAACGRRWVLLLVLSALSSTGMFGKDDKLAPEDLVGKHLASIGAPEARAGVQSRVANGTVKFQEVISQTMRLEGKAQVLSLGSKSKATFEFAAPGYKGEQFVFDGEQHMVAMVDPGRRSMLGDFLFAQTEILREGLFGGALTTAWPLLDVNRTTPRLTYQGLKKTNNQILHALLYEPRKRAGNGDLRIQLFFEPETFRHVATVYTLTLHSRGGSIKTGTDEVQTVVEERFGDFQETGGITLPRHWEIRYRRADSAKPREYQWDVAIGARQ